MSYADVLHSWGEEAKLAKDKLDKMRLWIKWAPKADDKDHKDIIKFTEMIEGEVFGNAESV